MWIEYQERQIRVSSREIDDPLFPEFEVPGEDLTFDDVVECVDGAYRLKPSAAQELEQELLNFEDAMQFALLTAQDGEYPCHGCAGENVFLKKGEVWRYGTTWKGNKYHLPDEYLFENRVVLVVQHRGSLDECLLEERRKVYHYALLAENLERPENARLVYAPGNLEWRDSDDETEPAC